MRAKYYLFGFIVLFLSCSICFVQAFEFSFVFPEDRRKELIFYIYNEELNEDYFGNTNFNDPWGNKVQLWDTMAVVITDIDVVDDLTSLKDGKNCDGWEIDVLIWNWTSDSSTFNDEEDTTEIKDVIIYEDPEDFGKISNLTLMFLWLVGVPIPVVDYFDELDFVNSFYEVQGTSIVCTWNITAGKTVKEIFTWDPSNGAPLGYMIITEKKNIIFQISTPAAIASITNFGVIITLVVIGAIVAVIMVFYIQEQRNVKKESEKVSVLDQKQFEAAETI